jgi:hypothetical protein
VRARAEAEGEVGKGRVGCGGHARHRGESVLRNWRYWPQDLILSSMCAPSLQGNVFVLCRASSAMRGD